MKTIILTDGEHEEIWMSLINRENHLEKLLLCKHLNEAQRKEFSLSLVATRAALAKVRFA